MPSLAQVRPWTEPDDDDWMQESEVLHGAFVEPPSRRRPGQGDFTYWPRTALIHDGLLGDRTDFSPSEALVRLFLRSVERAHATAPIPLFSWPREEDVRPELKTEAEILVEARDFVAGRVRSLLATIAQRAAVSAAREVRISQDAIRFSRDVADAITDRIPVSPYDAARFLDMLHKEIYDAARRGLTYDWGEVRRDERGLQLLVSSEVLRRPATRQRAEVIGGLEK